jgi:hypothetical protein
MSDPVEPELDDLSLDALFAEAKADAQPSEALMDRIVADAAEIAAVTPVVEQGPGIWERMLDALGGWPSLSGLATATVAGIYIGFSDPTLLETVGLSETSEVSTELLFGDDLYFDELTVGEG